MRRPTPTADDVICAPGWSRSTTIARPSTASCRPAARSPPPAAAASSRSSRATRPTTAGEPALAAAPLEGGRLATYNDRRAGRVHSRSRRPPRRFADPHRHLRRRHPPRQRLRGPDFHIGRTNDGLLAAAAEGHGARPGASCRRCSRSWSRSAAIRWPRRDATVRPADKDGCAPEDFYSTTNHRTVRPPRRPLDRSRRAAHGRRDRRRRTARPSAASCATCAAAIRSSAATTASASCPSSASATVTASRS